MHNAKPAQRPGDSSDCWPQCDLMLAKYILAALAIAFLLAALIRGAGSPQGRTWLLIACIFGIVSSWLFAKG
jgi:hypothetical protein